MDLALLFGNILSLLGMAAGVYYLVTTRKIMVSPQAPPAIGKDLHRILRRRRLGAALMTLIAVMFLIATNWFAEVRTIGMSVFWLLLMILLLWLVILAGLDILTTNRLRQHLLDEANDKFKDLVKKSGQSPPHSKDTPSDDEETDRD